MSKPAGPIVIKLKKRGGPKRSNEDDDEDERGESPGARSRTRSPLREGSRKSSPPASPAGKLAEGDKSDSVLNVVALEAIFARFHGQLDSWLTNESQKLKGAEDRGSGARESLERTAERINGFLRDYAPNAELGEDRTGDGFTTRALPQFLDLLEEDRRSLQDAQKEFISFADRRFPKNEEIAALKNDASPVPLMKAVLRLLASGPPQRSGGGDGEPTRRKRGGGEGRERRRAGGGGRERGGRAGGDRGGDRGAPAGEAPAEAGGRGRGRAPRQASPSGSVSCSSEGL
mmetsp:Transcript_29856/g.84093  ORF Transcript_29856/g.84093 Transcript_29856/m.84093 type:complete len:288 (-) Transcript_29856:169-1032(-)